MHATDELIQSPSTSRLEQWFQHLQSVPHRLPQTPSECLASGSSDVWTESEQTPHENGTLQTQPKKVEIYR